MVMQYHGCSNVQVERFGAWRRVCQRLSLPESVLCIVDTCISCMAFTDCAQLPVSLTRQLALHYVCYGSSSPGTYAIY